MLEETSKFFAEKAIKNKNTGSLQKNPIYGRTIQVLSRRIQFLEENSRFLCRKILILKEKSRFFTEKSNFRKTLSCWDLLGVASFCWVVAWVCVYVSVSVCCVCVCVWGRGGGGEGGGGKGKEGFVGMYRKPMGNSIGHPLLGETKQAAVENKRETGNMAWGWVGVWR